MESKTVKLVKAILPKTAQELGRLLLRKNLAARDNRRKQRIAFLLAR